MAAEYLLIVGVLPTTAILTTYLLSKTREGR
jgi:hypothetical protein